MKNILLPTLSLVILLFTILNCNSQNIPIQYPKYTISLSEAHIGDLEIYTKLLDSYKLLPEHIRQFYFDSRSVFELDSMADFDHPEIIRSAHRNKMPLIGGPMLGDLRSDGVCLWLRPSLSATLLVKVYGPKGKGIYRKKSAKAGTAHRMVLDGLSADTHYDYEVYTNRGKVAEGEFRTAPPADEQSTVRIVFGSCFHKIGLHNPNLAQQILSRKAHAMLLLGDIAVDDREGHINMHRADYLLRDVSAPWKKLSANIPLYACWDDHDYLNNDLSGIPDRFTVADRNRLRAVWEENWNNPQNSEEGIYFNTRIGQVEILMLDTRACRVLDERGSYASYLGMEQLEWLKQSLKESSAPYKIISSGTMWSNYITNGKDSWGTWDTLAREAIFSFIETENIGGVLLISGDRHGARGFTISRPSGFKLYEFEAASLGGVQGPAAMAKDSANQIFGYQGTDIIAFGEFTFEKQGDNPHVVFRLIDETGKICEEHVIRYSQLRPLK